MKKNILLAIFSGLLMWVAWPPTPYATFLLFVGLVPMLILMENIIKSSDKGKGRKIFQTTFLGFFTWNVLSIYWVYNALKDIGPITAIPITLIPFALGPLLMATTCWLYYRLRLKINRVWSLVGFVCCWVGYEYLNQTWDLSFPWMTLGNGFAVAHQWVQWYEFTGVYGGTLWIWIVNILIFLIYTGFSEAQTKQVRLRLIAAFVIVLLLPLGYSLITYHTYTEEPDPSNIVVVQPNIDPYAKQIIPGKSQIKVLAGLSDSIGQVNTEFFVWPETGIPDSEGFDEDSVGTNPLFLQIQHFLEKFKNGNVITGAATYKIYNKRATETASPIPGNKKVFFDSFNAAMNVENSAKVQFYHKSKLVPGAEELPFENTLSFLKPAFEHLGGSEGNYGTQPEPGVFYSQSGIGAVPAICYESIWGDWIAQGVKKGAQFIAIITNDGWWGNTSGKDQHIDYAKLRAIETRRWVCRSANTGISAFINQRGDIVKQTKWWVKTAIKQDINLNSQLTFYVKHGDYIPKAGSILATFFIAVSFIRFRYKQ